MRVYASWAKLKKMKSIIALSIIILSQTICVGQTQKTERIVQFSVEVKYIDLHEFVYNQTARFYSRRSNIPLSDFMEFSDSLTIEEIEECLNNENPKVRALGILSLYQSDNQINLLRIADFLEDSTVCLKGPYSRFSNSSSFPETTPAPSEDELIARAKDIYVADIASSIIRHYFKQSGHVYFDDEFELFLNERKGLEYTAGFLKLLKLKATGGISPFQKERQPLVEKLRDKIEKIKNDVDRSIYKIYLSTSEYELFSQDEIIAELNFLGAERVKQILMRQPPTIDPDLLNVQNKELYNFEYEMMCKWILLNAKEIFDETDTDFFIERAIYEKENTRTWRTPMTFPYWHMAAARVDEVNASEYVKSCLELFNNKYSGELCAELWHRKGIEDIDFILDWVFDGFALNQLVDSKYTFIENLDQKEDLVLLKRILSDERFENYMRVEDIVKIAIQVNKLADDKPIEDRLIRQIWHPFGLSHVDWWRDRAMEEYPNETKEMLRRTKILIDELRKIE